MSTTARRLSPAFAALALLLAAPAPAPVPDPEPPAAIKALLDRQVADWNKGDLDGFVDGYWRSPEMVFQSGGDRNVGWEAMRDRYRTRYTGKGNAMGKLAFSGLEIVPLAADSAFARGRWGLVLPDGKTPGGLFTLILRKLPEGWRIVHDHTSSAP